MTEQHSAGPSQFFEAHLFVCTNRRPDGHSRGSCASRGSEALRDYMKVRAKELGLSRIRVNTAGCLDRCELGPCVVSYPRGAWFRVADRTAVEAVLADVRSVGAASDLLLPARAD